MSTLFSHFFQKINQISPLEANFTEVLDAIALKPKTLYFYGKMPQNVVKNGKSTRPKTVAIVGSRHNTRYGEEVAYKLAYELGRRGIVVECLPGATAFVPALLDSGLPCDRFVFEGFLPPKKGRATRLEELSQDARTIVVYESPKRLERTLRQLAETMGSDRPASVSREISKLHETTHRATLGELAQYFATNQAKGEIVIVVEGYTTKKLKKTEN